MAEKKPKEQSTKQRAWPLFDAIVKDAPFRHLSPWEAADVFRPDYETLTRLLGVPLLLNADTTSGVPALAFDVWVAYELRRAGLDPDAVWPREEAPRIIARDIIPPITALITGIIGLGDFSSHPGRKEDYIQMLALGTAATSATLNIYDRHFLFGAENVGAVQTMALKAQSVHAQSVLKQKNLSFEMAMQHLIDNQGQCSPQSILSLARSVIKDTKLVGTDGAPAAAGAGGVPAPPPSEGKITVVPAI